MRIVRTLPELPEATPSGGSPASPLRRAVLGAGLRRGLATLAVLALGTGLAGRSGALSAQPARGGGRGERSQLAPDERDRLRRDLRERGFEGWPNQAPRRGREDAGRQRHLSEEERRQLRRQLREADGRRR